MVQKERLITAINSFINDEILPSVGGLAKWGLAIGINAYVAKQLSEGILVSLGYEDDKGMIDEEKLYHDLKEVATKQGPVTQEIKQIGSLTFTASDVDALYRRLK